MNCPRCNTQVYDDEHSTTLVGYMDSHFTDERGTHDHDDNCQIYKGHCDSGHRLSWRHQNSCPACDWKGKTECFCHPLGVIVFEKTPNGWTGFLEVHDVRHS